MRGRHETRLCDSLSHTDLSSRFADGRQHADEHRHRSSDALTIPGHEAELAI